MAKSTSLTIPTTRRLCVYRVRPQSAVRDGDFKLVVTYGENGGADSYALYNLKTNISENVNLAASMPDKVASMKALLDNYLESVDASFAYDVKAPTQLSWKEANPALSPLPAIDHRRQIQSSRNLGLSEPRRRLPALVNVSAFQSGRAARPFPSTATTA